MPGKIEVGKEFSFHYVNNLHMSSDLKGRNGQKVEVIEIKEDSKTPWKYKVRFPDGHEDIVSELELDEIK